jgi:hypothetical protein
MSYIVICQSYLSNLLKQLLALIQGYNKNLRQDTLFSFHFSIN